MPTTCGSPIYRDHVVGKDAACVTQLVKAGAIVLGKSVTTEFAGAHAGKTHNPHNLRHTPAGSSSGSAAAVADFMAPIGYGTQTAGSVIRPGAFNGVVAYKGTFGWADMTGIKPYAPSLDTLGFFAREANDLALVRAAYGHAPADPPETRAAHRALPHPVVGRGRAFEPRNIETAARALRAAGARVRAWQMPESWEALLPAQNRLMTKEATKAYAWERARFPHLISPSLTLALANGDGVSRSQLPTPRSASVVRWATCTTSGRNSTSCWRPRPRARRRRAWDTPAIRCSTASGPCSACPASRCRSTRARSACRCRCSSSGRCAATTS